MPELAFIVAVAMCAISAAILLLNRPYSIMTVALGLFASGVAFVALGLLWPLIEN